MGSRGKAPAWSGVKRTKSPEADIFLFQRLISFKQLSHKFGKFRLHGERGSTSAPAYSGIGGTKADDIFLFQRLVS